MPLLSRPWQLHDVQDVEALALYAIRRSRHTGDLRFHEREDLTAFVVAGIWECSRNFHPGRGAFSTIATVAAARRIVDWQRLRNGRSRWQFGDHVYERERPQLVPLDDRPGEALAAREGDPADGCDPDLERLLGTGDRQRARDLETLGLRPPRRAA